MKALLLPASVLLAFLVSSCGSEPAAGHGDKATGDAAEEPWKGNMHGEEHPLGEVKVGAFTAEVTQEGEIAAGGEVGFDIDFPADQAPTATVRIWLGTASGAGSRKTKLALKDGGAHAHVDAPAEVTDATQLWIEIEMADGNQTAAIDLHR